MSAAPSEHADRQPFGIAQRSPPGRNKAQSDTLGPSHYGSRHGVTFSGRKDPDDRWSGRISLHHRVLVDVGDLLFSRIDHCPGVVLPKTHTDGDMPEDITHFVNVRDRPIDMRMTS